MQPFVYDENELHKCAALPRTDNSACLSLYNQHQQHYNRHSHPSQPYNHNKRMSHFLESVTLVHNHNSRKDTTKSYFRITLNQFSDYDPHELPIHPWDNQLPLSETQQTQEELSRDGSLKVDSSTGPVWISASTIRTYRTSRKDDGGGGGSKNQDSSLLQSHDALGDFVVDPMNKDWTQYLNWATTDNPDGVPIVHSSNDQGTCGSCWAWAAIGSLEANIARHAAFAAYWSIIEKYHLQNSLNKIPPSIHQEAVLAAQQAEKTTILQTILSVQELVDCDNEYDQGCIGGNPLLAYPFIRRYGLVSQSSYPYQGIQSKCHKHLLTNPTATVESWGMIVPKSEESMELVLRSLGPIAVGLDGTDPLFLSYKGGIFDSENCSRHHPNHAMLLVGMGEEYDEESGETTKYWIGRNSWGTRWGENGLIRIRRRKGLGTSGVCGIALNPSVALGGSLLSSNKELSRWQLAPSIGLNSSNTAVDLILIDEGIECTSMLCLRGNFLRFFKKEFNGFSVCSQILVEAGIVFVIIALLVRSKLQKIKVPVTYRSKNNDIDLVFVSDAGTIREKSEQGSTSYGAIV